jgi:hypothetical protein
VKGLAGEEIENLRLQICVDGCHFSCRRSPAEAIQIMTLGSVMWGSALSVRFARGGAERTEGLRSHGNLWCLSGVFRVLLECGAARCPSIDGR